ncbi:MAG: prepilin-type N-terminal cleavage/methylation domain-containing protein [Planctomycetota bacterium]
MRRQHGFTLAEAVVAVAIFATGSLYIYSTFTGVTRSSQTASVQIDLGSQNKKALTKIYNELQATSMIAQDTDGLDSTPPEAVFNVSTDNGAPTPYTKAKLVTRTMKSATQTGGKWEVGANKMQAREMEVSNQSQLRFRKVIGYQFNATAGSILPQWSGWVTYRVDNQRRLIREADGRPTRTVAQRVDVFNVNPRADGTVVISLVTGRRSPDGQGVRRYANAITINPKN